MVESVIIKEDSDKYVVDGLNWKTTDSAIDYVNKNYDNVKIILKHENGLEEVLDKNGLPLKEAYSTIGDSKFNSYHCDELVKGCPVDYSPCYFPFCENNMACNVKGESKKEEVTVINQESTIDDVGADNVSSVKQHFDYQLELNTLDVKINKLKKAQEDIFNGIKTDIETIFIGYDCSTIDLEVKLTQHGIRIIYPVKKYNDYNIVSPVDTDLFTKLNQLMGVNGKLNIVKDKVLHGNHVYTIELDYEV